MRAWLLSTVLALDLGAGPSRVELDVSGLEQHMDDAALHRFHGELLMRLLEAGYGIGAEGEVRLSLISAGDTIVVECSVGDHRERLEVDDADAAILGLELIHRAVDLVARCTERAPGSGLGMVLDSDSSIETGAVLVELAESPITLVSDEGDAAWRLCVRSRGSFVIAVEQSCDAGEASPVSDPRQAMARWQAKFAEPELDPEIEPKVEPAIEVEEQPPASPSTPAQARAWGPSLGAGIGVQLRMPGVAASVRADVAALHRSGAFVGMVGSLAPSRAESLAVIDALALASVGWRARVAERVALRPSLGLGLAVHRFGFADEPVGHRVDFALRVPLELELRLAARVYLSLAAAVVVTPRRIEHTLLGDRIWSRGAVRFEGLIGLRFDWLPGPVMPST